MKSYLQKMGRSLQLPVAVLPAAALLQGIGHMLPHSLSIYKMGELQFSVTSQSFSQLD